MSALVPLGIIALCGAIGGAINAIITDNGFILPREENSQNASIIIPGVITNILMGGASGFLYWGFTEANSLFTVYGPAAPGTEEIKISVYSIAMVILVGATGSRYLTTEIDKRLLKAAAISAAAARPSQEDAQKMANATPIQAFRIARKMYQKGLEMGGVMR